MKRKTRLTILDSMKGIPITRLRPSVVLSARRGKRYVGGVCTVHCPKCKEESIHGWQEEFKRLKCDKCGYEWTPPTYEPEGIPDEAPMVFCPVFGCGKRMKSISYDELSPAQRKARYICDECHSYIELEFALYEE